MGVQISKLRKNAGLSQKDWAKHNFQWIAILLLIALFITVNTILHRTKKVITND